MSRYHKRQSIIFKIFNSKIFLIIILVIFLFAVYFLVKISFRRNQVDQKIAELEKQAEKIKKENAAIEKLIEYLEDPVFKEREARLKLGLQKPDEKVVVIIPPDENSGLEVEKKEVSSQKKRLNPQKWWNYFWGNKK